jgi:hypothetical protein
MKLEFEKTEVHVTDKDTGDKWVVQFTGTWQHLDGKVFKNGRYVTTYSPRGGHANKTMAMTIIKAVKRQC